MIYKVYRYRPERQILRAEHVAWCKNMDGGVIHLPEECPGYWYPVTGGTIPDKQLHTWPHRLQMDDVRQLITEQKPNALMLGDVVILQSERIYTSALSGTWLLAWLGEIHLDNRDLFDIAMEETR